MVLSPAFRVVSVASNVGEWRANRERYAIFTCSSNFDVGPSELVFPDPSIQRATPGFGQAAYRVQVGALEKWLQPFEVQLSDGALTIGAPRASLVAIALMPRNGCQMDVQVLVEN